MKIIQPKGWKRPRGYSNGVLAAGNFLSIAGQIGWDAKGKIASSTLTGQVRQALENIVAILQEAKASSETLVRMTWYVTDKREYLSAQEEIGTIYREVIGDHYPAMTLIEVSALLEDGAKVEIEASAVIPAGE